ncbi:unnamed protein product [Schistosoma curassoni]|uniref:Transmembrane protein n=1 Tax=Schistosoma curassoni TaxID=6186 RepID=A0A183JZF4_9TREM|nr:unnamed protein product [Schistosoma curassoni]
MERILSLTDDELRAELSGKGYYPPPIQVQNPDSSDNSDSSDAAEETSVRSRNRVRFSEPQETVYELYSSLWRSDVAIWAYTSVILLHPLVTGKEHKISGNDGKLPMESKTANYDLTRCCGFADLGGFEIYLNETDAIVFYPPSHPDDESLLSDSSGGFIQWGVPSHSMSSLFLLFVLLGSSWFLCILPS